MSEETCESITDFSELSLPDELLSAISKSGYTKPTAIQAVVIPHMLAGRDVLGQSQTGSGKTAAFALPILANLKTKNKLPTVLVLAPTRELAIQVAKSFETYGANLPRVNVATIYGGQDYEIQFRQLKKRPQIVVGTPGRVIDHIRRGTLELSSIQCLVLDEADEMLNLGFHEDVEFVLQKTPEERQIALFSATMPPAIQKIADRYLKDPARIRLKKKTETADSIRQRAVFVSNHEKTEALIRFLEVEQTDGVLVFTRTRETTTQVAEQLGKAGFATVALNGDMQQKSRERTIQRFKDGHLNVLVATDIAARGLDMPRITHVFNYDLPDGSESYIHRVGRTGRAGRTGEAIILLTPAQRGKLKYIEKATRQKIEIVERPGADQINAARVDRLKQSIEKTITGTDLSFLQNVIKEYAESSNHSPELIAAALVKISQKGRSLQTVDRPAKTEDRSRNSRESRRDGEKFRDERSNGPKRDRNSHHPQSGMQRYRIAVGKRDGVRPGNIVGAVANEAGIEGTSIGPISIQNSFSTIDLPTDLPFDIFEALENTRVAGRLIKLQLADSKDAVHGQRKPRNGKPARPFFKAKKGFVKKGGKRKPE
jgi:ATP-dependent RNA helicase DeaD